MGVGAVKQDQLGPNVGSSALPADILETRATDLTKWTLTRIDVRTSLSNSQWPVARVELQHDARGRVSDIATAPGAFEAMFMAAGQIVGKDPKLLSYNVCSGSLASDGSLTVRVDIELEVDGKACRGSSVGSDLVRCSVLAWLQAACGFASSDLSSSRCRTRPFQVSGIDENDDLWIFASNDEGAARAIEEEFMSDGYSEIRLLI